MFFIGQNSERRQTELEAKRADNAEASLKKAQAEASKRAHGAEGDANRMADRAGANDEFDRVLDTINDDGADAAPGEHGEGGDESRTA